MPVVLRGNCQARPRSAPEVTCLPGHRGVAPSQCEVGRPRLPARGPHRRSGAHRSLPRPRIGWAAPRGPVPPTRPEAPGADRGSRARQLANRCQSCPPPLPPSQAPGPACPVGHRIGSGCSRLARRGRLPRPGARLRPWRGSPPPRSRRRAPCRGLTLSTGRDRPAGHRRLRAYPRHAVARTPPRWPGPQILTSRLRQSKIP